MLAACADPEVDIAATVYDTSDSTPRCPRASKSGAGGVSNSNITTAGVRYSLRTPANYDPTVAHPLLVIYAAATHDRFRSEHFARLTKPATGRGFIVAYTDHYRMTPRRIESLARVVDDIAEDWCVDEQRIAVAGHSDGGTVANAIAILPGLRARNYVIASSAAGMRAADLETYDCPAPRSVMVMHNSGDELFPGFGRELAAWWAACNECDGGASSNGSCMAYAACAGGDTTLYCEREGGHREWPHDRQAILDFLALAFGTGKD